METALAWVSSAGGLAGFIALVVALLQTRRRRFVPDPALRGLLEALFRDFNEIVATGAAHAPWFLEDERQAQQGRLSSLQNAIVDEALHAKVAAARAEYHDCWACASSAHSERQVKAATAGRRATEEAIERLNVLMVKHGHL